MVIDLGNSYGEIDSPLVRPFACGTARGIGHER